MFVITQGFLSSAPMLLIPQGYMPPRQLPPFRTIAITDSYTPQRNTTGNNTPQRNITDSYMPTRAIGGN